MEENTRAVDLSRHQRGRATVVGAGILGLWQAIELARAGWQVRLLDADPKPFAATASRYAGAMIAPYCEAEAAPPLVRDYGLAAARIWRERFPDLVENGTLVLAAPRDLAELRRFARLTTGHRAIAGDEIAGLEPDLAGRFSSGLFFPDEAHMATPTALLALLRIAQAAGAQAHFGLSCDLSAPRPDDDGWVIDCRGLAARDALADLRGVRGERCLIRSGDVSLNRTVRLLHPRQPLYVVPWADGLYMVGATVIESEDTSPMTLRSALELLGLAYALHPGFAEAEIVDLGAGLRPSYPDNVPRVRIDRATRTARVNGAYRHGFLLAPVLAEVVVKALADDQPFDHPLLEEGPGRTLDHYPA